MARQLTWTPPGGPPVPLTDRAAGYRVLAAGTRGLSSPPYRMTTETYAGVAGSALRSLQADQRPVALGLQIEGGSPAELRQRWRALVRAMRPAAGDGVLTVTDEWGDVRRLFCRYTGGLEGEGGARAGGRSGRAVVELAAFDPWWYGPEQTVDFGLAAPSQFFPMFPLVLSPSAIQGSFTVDLSGADTESFPVWTVTGPGSALTLTNTTTGRSLAVTANLGDGQSMTIDTRPGRQSVRRNDGTNLMGALATDPALWSLTDGPNAVTALLTNAGAASRIRGVYTPRFAGI